MLIYFVLVSLKCYFCLIYLFNGMSTPCELFEGEIWSISKYCILKFLLDLFYVYKYVFALLYDIIYSYQIEM